MSEPPLLDASSFAAALARARRPFHGDYFAMYSSWLGGIVTDPLLMLVPVDDHLVHRGDGVFETLKYVDGRIYTAAGHRRRLLASAEGIGLSLPWSAEELDRRMVETARAGGRRDGMLRLLAARGPGSLDVNPYRCPAPQLYVVAAALSPPFLQRRPEGARAVASRVPAKPSVLATLKTCNYLPNVLMKKEALDRGADFPVGFDEEGHLAEGATESVMIVTRDGRLLSPEAGAVLPGTTVDRVNELAHSLVSAGLLREVAVARIPRPEVERAAEILIVSTTADVAPVVEFEGRPFGGGRPGPVGLALNRLLQDDIRGNRALQTAVFE